VPLETEAAPFATAVLTRRDTDRLPTVAFLRAVSGLVTGHGSSRSGAASLRAETRGSLRALTADLRVGPALGRELSDLRLLGGQLVERLDETLTHRLARGQELAARTLRECVGPRID
jgi:hypothetical protein